VPASPVQRNAPPGEAAGRPAYRSRDAIDDDRIGPKQMGIPYPRNNAPREAAPVAREIAPTARDASPQPRPSRPPEAAVVAPPQAQRPAPAPAPAATVAPQAPPLAAPPAQRPPGEHRMTRPEPPHGKEERRDEKPGGEKQR
jgi:hypothetical protein